MVLCFYVPGDLEKQKARPEGSISEPGDDHSVGLWVNYDLLRRHRVRGYQVVFHPPEIAVTKRYLELADIALGTSTAEKKSKPAYEKVSARDSRFLQLPRVRE